MCTLHYTSTVMEVHLFPCKLLIFITLLSTCLMGDVIYYVANSITSFNCYIKSPVNPRVGADRGRTNPGDRHCDGFVWKANGSIMCISSFIITISFIHNHPYVMNNLLLIQHAILCKVKCKMGIMLLCITENSESIREWYGPEIWNIHCRIFP
jgi:hypothetical protein